MTSPNEIKSIAFDACPTKVASEKTRSKSLERWIAEIQYQALNDNYLVMPQDWVHRMQTDPEFQPFPEVMACGEGCSAQKEDHA